MQQLPYDDLDKLAEVLQVVFSGTNATVKEANDVLAAMARDPLRYTGSVMKIITSEKNDINIQKIKKAAALTSLRLLSPFIENKNSPPEQKKEILEAIITGLYSANVSPNIKSSLQQFLSVFYHGDSTGTFKEQSLKFAKEKLTNGSISDYAGSLCLIYSIIESPMNSQEALSNWFQFLYEEVANVGDAIVEELGTEIIAILKGETPEQKVINVFTGLEVLKVWTDVMLEFIQKLGKGSTSNIESITKPDYIELIIDKERIGTILLKTLVLQIPTEHQIKSCMFSTSGLKFDALLNQIKMRTIKCFELILDFMVDAAKVQSKSKLLNANYNKLYYIIQTDVVKAILQSLMHLCKSNYAILEKGLQDKAFQECLSQCISTLAKLTAFQELYTLFSDHKNMIIMDICLPLAACTKKDLEMFSTDPQGFVDVTTNLEEDQETSNVKIQTLQFLRKICENIDGAASAVVLLIIMLLDYSLHSNDLASIEANFPKLVDYRDTTILKDIDPRVRVETCLLALTSINECIYTRKDLLYVMDEHFAKNHEYFLGANLDPLIKTRMCLFLGSYVSILFRREESKALYSQHLSFLIECAGITDPNQAAVAEQANETLYDMLAEKTHVVRMAPLVSEILAKITSYVQTTQCTRFFDVLHEVVRLYSPYIIANPDILLKLVEDLKERGIAEYGFLVNDKGLSKMTLTKIWNIIKIIGKNKSYLVKQNEIEQLLIPMFMFIVSNESQPFDDELLDYLATTTQVTQQVSPIGWELFKILPVIFERYQNLITPIFTALNQIIVYGKAVIEENNDMKTMLVDIGIKAMNTTHPDAGEAAVSLGAVLLQILIQYVGIPNEEWKKMLIACFEKIKTADKKFLKARITGVFLLAFLRNFEFTQACLLEMEALGVVMGLITDSHEVLMFNSHIYDRKIFLITISRLLGQQGLHQIIVEKLPQLLDVLISYLSYVQLIEHKQALMGNKKQSIPDYDSDDEESGPGYTEVLASLLDNNTIGFAAAQKKLNDLDYDDDDDDDDDDEEDDDDDDDEEDRDYFPTEKDEANYYVTKLVSDIKGQDEFMEFKNVINKLKETNTQLLAFLATSLAERKKTLMKEVLQSQRVVVQASDEGKNQQTQARKVVKATTRKIAQVNNQG